MKAVVVHEPGGIERLVYQEVEKPTIKTGWSLIQVKSFGINRSEIFTREGKSPSVQFPRILGIECVGIIAETSDEDRFSVGQKVISIMGEMGRAFDGSYAEYVLVPNNQIYMIHTELPWEILAAIPETYYTAYGSFLNLKIEEGETILVRGASSGVGIAFKNIIKSIYPTCSVIGTTRRNARKQQQLIDLGFDSVILDENGVLKSEDRFNKILELVGPATIKDSFHHLISGGIICSTGQLGGKWFLENFDPIMEIPEACYLTAFYSGNVTSKKIMDMFSFIQKYNVKISVEKVFQIHEIAEAHAYLDSNNGIGKVVVLV